MKLFKHKKNDYHQNLLRRQRLYLLLRLGLYLSGALCHIFINYSMHSLCIFFQIFTAKIVNSSITRNLSDDI